MALCRHCAEPWDNDTFHDVAEKTDTTYDEVFTAFRSLGCGAVEHPFSGRKCVRSGAPSLIGDLTDTFGHDPDGLESDLSDAEAQDCYDPQGSIRNHHESSTEGQDVTIHLQQVINPQWKWSKKIQVALKYLWFPLSLLTVITAFSGIIGLWFFWLFVTTTSVLLVIMADDAFVHESVAYEFAAQLHAVEKIAIELRASTSQEKFDAGNAILTAMGTATAGGFRSPIVNSLSLRDKQKG